MLEIDEVEWSNFLSYGDYVSKIKIGGLGQCLITGEIVDEGNRETYDQSGTKLNRSNGSGKSSLVNAIQWILFGRTMHSANPGNNVINWHTGKDCYGKITFKSGDFIMRTRNMGGKNELFYVKDGDEKKLVADTLSTLKNQQIQLTKDFNLDWEIFCGSVFFNQYSKPWLEMADAPRKKALERLLHVDRFAYYAKIAKDSTTNLNTEVQGINSKIESLQSDIIRFKAEIERIKADAINFQTQKQNRSDQALINAAAEEKKRDEIALPDLDKLKAKWEVITQVQQRIGVQRQKIHTLNDQISQYDSAISAAKRVVVLWTNKNGKICTECEQDIPHVHVQNKISPYEEKIKTTEAKVVILREEQTKLRNIITESEALLQAKKPKQTIEEAKSIHARWNQHNAEAIRLKKSAESIMAEIGRHDISISKVEQYIADAETKILELQKRSESSELLNKHYNYIYKAYNDRGKVKSFILREHLPFINSRLHYYLEVFGLDIQIELTDTLGIKSNLWGYEFESGGERKRTDVALMLATFDFHEQMYGRQCNTLVLDEVDGRLDDDGIEALINIIKNDMASKVETILIISHKDSMHDVFPSEIKVKRENRMSYIDTIYR